MARDAGQGKNGRARYENGPLHHHALQQSPLHDALLHSALRLCAESSLCSTPHFLYRPPDLRAPRPHVLLHRRHVDRARHDGTESLNSRNVRRLGHARARDHVLNSDLLVDPIRLSAGLVPEYSEILHRRGYFKFFFFSCLRLEEKTSELPS